MSELYEGMLYDVMGVVTNLMSSNDAVRVEILRDGLKVSIAVGWPDDEDDEADEA